MSSIQTALLTYAVNHHGMNLIEAERVFEDEGYPYVGNYAYITRELQAEYGAASYWLFWSLDAIAIIKDLVDKGLLRIVRAKVEDYEAMGKVSRFPEAKQNRIYTVDHWVPVKLIPAEDADND